MTLVEVCKLDELADGEAHRFDIEDRALRLAVVKLTDSDIRVIDDECSHADYSLSGGICDIADMTIECPKHGALFSLVDGEPQSLPATKPVKVYATQIKDGVVRIEVDDE